MSIENAEPWQWPDAHWQKLVNQVRAGRALRPTLQPCSDEVIQIETIAHLRLPVVGSKNCNQ